MKIMKNVNKINPQCSDNRFWLENVNFYLWMSNERLLSVIPTYIHVRFIMPSDTCFDTRSFIFKKWMIMYILVRDTYIQLYIHVHIAVYRHTCLHPNSKA